MYVGRRQMKTAPLSCDDPTVPDELVIRHPRAPLHIPDISVQQLQELKKAWEKEVVPITNSWIIPFALKPLCDCGAEKCNSNLHSSWCPKAL